MMTAEHDKCKSTQVGMPEKNATTNPMQTNTHTGVFPQHTRGRTYRSLTTLINPKHKHRRLRSPRAAPTHAAAPSSTGRDSRASLGTLALPPASHCANTRAPTAPRARPPAGEALAPGAGGRAGWGRSAAGPGLGARGGDEGRARGGARLTWAGGSS